MKKPNPPIVTQAAVKRAKVYDLGGNDAFWVDNCGQPFPKVSQGSEFPECFTGFNVSRRSQGAGQSFPKVSQGTGRQLRPAYPQGLARRKRDNFIELLTSDRLL